jgi:hypothetical protein
LQGLFLFPKTKAGPQESWERGNNQSSYVTALPKSTQKVIPAFPFDQVFF